MTMYNGDSNHSRDLDHGQRVRVGNDGFPYQRTFDQDTEAMAQNKHQLSNGRSTVSSNDILASSNYPVPYEIVNVLQTYLGISLGRA